MITYTRQTAIVAGRFDRERCPCCGGMLADPKPLGTGVSICGICAGHGHCLVPGGEAELGRAVLAAIRKRNDGPIAALLPGSYLPCSEAAQ